MVEDLGYRRIQRTGRGSYILSLPKDWVLTSELKKGSQLAVQRQDDSSLLLVPRKVLEKTEDAKTILKEFIIHTTLEDKPPSISRKIKSLYAISADLIRVTFKKGDITSEQKTAIKNTVRMLLGSEIVKESPNEIQIQVLINHPSFPIEDAIRRMFAIAEIMDRDAISALKNFNEAVLQEVMGSDDDLDRLNLYVIRQLKYGIEHNLYQELGFRTPKEFLGYRIVAKNIENVGDNAVGTAKNILLLKKLIDDQFLSLDEMFDEETYLSILKFSSFSQNLFEDSLKALFKRDYEHSDEVISRFMSKGLQLENDTVQLIFNKRLDPNVASVLRLILDNSRKMMEYARDIAEVTLNRTVEEISTSP